jgi:hypothetical protein
MRRAIGIPGAAIQRAGIRCAGILSAALLGAAPLAAPLSPSKHPQPAADKGQPRALMDLVGPRDPLTRHDLRFDPSFAQQAMDYIRSGDAGLLARLAETPAATQMLKHARNFDYDVPTDSPAALVASLLTPRSKHQDGVDACARALAYFSGPLLDDPHWVMDDLRYLPDDFRFHATLFLTFGYDIGVAFGSSASLNCAHPHFSGHPRELTYYAIHELHHVGFMAYQPPPKVADLKTCGDLARLVAYSTQMEGMAVLAATARRREDHALADDQDYVALQDKQRMQHDEAAYFEDLRTLEARAAQPADADAWAVIERMSSGERLWYRVGARMAQRIEEASGRAALVDLIKTGPAVFSATYKQVTSETAPRQGSAR